MMVKKNINPLVSVIMATYNEADNLPLLYKRLFSVASEMAEYDFEFIFVDDCSKDKTPDILADLRKADDRVIIIRFAKNCGSHAADSAGLHFCRGNLAIIMAADLQDPPEIIIPKTIEQWKKGYKVVWSVREKRRGESFITLLFSRLYYFLMNLLTDIQQPPTGADAFLLDLVVIDAFRQSPEKHSSNIMLIAWLGFPQTSISYVKEARHAGQSKWTISKKIQLSLDSLISFSYVPIRGMSLLGIICAMIGGIYGMHIFINAFFNNIPIEGWSSTMIAILIIGGIQMVMLGFLGEYLWRTYDETRGRPRYIIEKTTLIDSPPKCSEKRHDEK